MPNCSSFQSTRHSPRRSLLSVIALLALLFVACDQGPTAPSAISESPSTLSPGQPDDAGDSSPEGDQDAPPAVGRTQGGDVVEEESDLVQIAADIPAVATFVVGTVEAERQGERFPVEIGAPLESRDTLITGEGAYIEVQLGDIATLRVEASTRVTLEQIIIAQAASRLQVRVDSGSVLARVDKLASGETMRIRTANSVAGVRGTQFRVEVAESGADRVSVREGAVSIVPVTPQVSRLLDAVAAEPAAQATDSTGEILPPAPSEEAEVANDTLAVLEAIGTVVEPDQEIEIDAQVVDQSRARVDRAAAEAERLVGDARRAAAEERPAEPIGAEPSATAPSSDGPDPSREPAPAVAVVVDLAAVAQTMRQSQQSAAIANRPQPARAETRRALDKIDEVVPVELGVRRAAPRTAADQGGEQSSDGDAPAGVAGQEPEPASVTLVPLTLIPEPSDADVLISGRSRAVGRTSALFVQGTTVTVTVSREGYETKELEYQLSSEGGRTVRVRLAEVAPADPPDDGGEEDGAPSEQNPTDADPADEVSGDTPAPAADTDGRAPSPVATVPLTIRAVPSTASIRVPGVGAFDGVFSGEYRAGDTVEATVSAPGYVAQTVRYSADPGDEGVYTVTLDRQPARLILEVTPADAEIRIAGELRGRGTATYETAPGSRVAVEVSAPEYVTVSRSVTVREPGDNGFSIALQRRRYPLRVDAEPSGATIRVAGEVVGTGFFQGYFLPEEELDVSVEADGYRAERRSVSVDPAGNTRLSVRLERSVSPVTITSDLPEAIVAVAGIGSSEGAFTATMVVDTLVRYTVSAPGYEPATDTLRVVADVDQNVRQVTLRPAEVGVLIETPVPGGQVLVGGVSYDERYEGEATFGSDVRYEVRAPGYLAESGRLTVSASAQQNHVRVSPRPAQMAVVVETPVSGGQVVVGGVAYDGRYEAEATFGSEVAYEVRAPGHLVETGRLSVSASAQENRVSVSPQPAQVGFAIATTVPGAQVVVGGVSHEGRYQGEAAFGSEVSYEVRAPGYVAERGRLTVAASAEQNEVRVSLRPARVAVVVETSVPGGQIVIGGVAHDGRYEGEEVFGREVAYEVRAEGHESTTGSLLVGADPEQNVRTVGLQPASVPIRIAAEPGEAAITVDGESFAGLYEADAIWGTEVSYVVRSPGYREASGSIVAGATAEENTLVVTLEPAEIAVAIEADTDGATVSVSGREYAGRYSEDILFGSVVSYRVTAPGYKPQSGELSVSAEPEENTRLVTLEPAWVPVVVEPEVAGATVVVNGRRYPGSFSGEARYGSELTYSVEATGYRRSGGRFTVAATREENTVRPALEPADVPVVIEVDPAEARLSVDGSTFGGRYEGLMPFGTVVRYRADAPGYEPVDGELVVAASAWENTETLRLRPAEIPVTIESDVAGAQIVVDGRTYPRRYEGTHRYGTAVSYEVRAEGYQSLTDRFDVRAEASMNRRSVTLSQIRYPVLVLANPEEAQIRLDGREVGRGIYRAMHPAGDTITIDASAQGYFEDERSVSLDNATVHIVRFDLESRMKRLELSVDPPSATVTVDDAAVGQGAVAIDVEYGREITVRAEADGYLAQEATFRMPREDIAATVSLQPRPVPIEIVAEPASAVIRIDGGTVGTGSATAMVVPGEAVTVAVEAEGYEPETVRIVAPETPTRRAILLRRQMGTIEIVTAPAATVRVDGRVVGSGEVVRHRIPAGEEVEVTVDAPGFDAASGSVAVGPDETRRVRFDLAATVVPLIVQTDPPDASLFIDGIAVGRGTYTAQLPVGHEMSLRAEAEHYEVAETTFTVDEQARDILLRLQPILYEMAVEAEPQEAQIYLNEEFAGTGYVLGEYRFDDEVAVRAEAEGYHGQQLDVRIDGSRRQTVWVTLEPILRYTRVYFQALPPDAEIEINGVTRGAGLAVLEAVEGDPLEVEVKLPGYVAVAQTVDATPEARYRFELEPEIIETQVTIRTSPSDAAIEYAGREIGLGSGTIDTIVGERVVVRASRRGFEEVTQTIEVEEDGEYRLDLTPKPVEWAAEIGPMPARHSLQLAEGGVVYSDENGTLGWLDLDGSVRWRAETANRPNLNNGPSVGAGYAFFSGVEEFIVVDAAYGVVTRRQSLEEGASHLFGRRSNVVGGYLVYPEDRRLVLLAPASGRELREIGVPNGVATTPVAYGNEILVVADDGEMLVVDAENGRVRKRAYADAFQPAPSAPAVANGVVYFADRDGMVFGVDIEREEVVVELSLGAEEGEDVASDPVVGRAGVYFTIADRIFPIRFDGGRLFGPLSEATAPPAIVRGESGEEWLVYGDDRAILHVLDSATGERLGRLALAAPVTAAPTEAGVAQVAVAVGDGTIVLVNVEGVIAASAAAEAD